MAADPLAPVARGDDVLTTAFSAAGINAVRDAARKVRDQWPREGPKPGGGPIPSLEVLVRNDTGGDLDAFSVVVAQPGAVVDVVTLPYEQSARPVYAADAPTGPTDRPLVLSEPIPDGQIGRAVISGHAVVRILEARVGDGWQYARCLEADATRMRFAAAGPVRVLRQLARTGATALYEVVVDADTDDGWVRGVPASYDVFPVTLATDTLVTLTEPGYYLLFAAVEGALTAKNLASNNNQIAVLLAGWGDAGRSRAVVSTLALLRDSGNVGPILARPTFAGSAPLIDWLRLTPSTVPYPVRLRWGAYRGAMSDGGADGSGISWADLATYFTIYRRVVEFAAVRIPGIQQPYFNPAVQPWTLIGEAQPVSGSGGSGASAVDDGYTVAAGGILDVLSPGVLANDVVPAGYSAVLDTPPTHGTLAFNGNGSFKYTQSGDLTGLVPPVDDVFTYHLSNGTTNSQPATVTITITGGSTGHGGFAPVFTSDGALVTSGSGTGTAGSGASTGGGTA